MPTVLTIDIGNTHTHWGLLQEATDECQPEVFPTIRNSADQARYEGMLGGALSRSDQVAFASVVPAAVPLLEDFLRRHYPHLKVFHLQAGNMPGDVKISYPQPREIGEDRLANAVAATRLHDLPAVVIDLGTAVTFDIISPDKGYEGGIIAPGIRIMTDYLHRQTALLPQLEEPLWSNQIIGKSTREAMTIGCLVGFRGMINALLQEISRELQNRQTPLRSIIFTGGTGFLATLDKDGMNLFSSSPVSTLSDLPVQVDPAVTLRGLFLAASNFS